MRGLGANPPTGAPISAQLPRLATLPDIFARYVSVFRSAWAVHGQLTPKKPHPAGTTVPPQNLEITDTPALPPAPARIGASTKLLKRQLCIGSRANRIFRRHNQSPTLARSGLAVVTNAE